MRKITKQLVKLPSPTCKTSYLENIIQKVSHDNIITVEQSKWILFHINWSGYPPIYCHMHSSYPLKKWNESLFKITCSLKDAQGWDTPYNANQEDTSAGWSAGGIKGENEVVKISIIRIILYAPKTGEYRVNLNLLGHLWGIIPPLLSFFYNFILDTTAFILITFFLCRLYRFSSSRNFTWDYVF